MRLSNTHRHTFFQSRFSTNFVEHGLLALIIFLWTLKLPGSYLFISVKHILPYVLWFYRNSNRVLSWVGAKDLAIALEAWFGFNCFLNYKQEFSASIDLLLSFSVSGSLRYSLLQIHGMGLSIVKLWQKAHVWKHKVPPYIFPCCKQVLVCWLSCSFNDAKHANAVSFLIKKLKPSLYFYWVPKKAGHVCRSHQFVWLFKSAIRIIGDFNYPTTRMFRYKLWQKILLNEWNKPFGKTCSKRLPVRWLYSEKVFAEFVCS